jgi:hypothetical protein
MHLGHIISGSGHSLLIGWMLFGGFSTPPEPAIEVTEVALISPEEFAALSDAVVPPGAETEVADLPQPAPATQSPNVEATRDSRPPATRPQSTPEPQPEAAPEAPQITPPPRAEVEDQPPEVTPPTPDRAVVIPERAAEAPRAVPRIAPRPVARPAPDARADVLPQTQTAPSPDASEKREETQEAAPPEATTRIVTEAEEQGDGPPKVSARPPRNRPVRTAVKPDPAPKPAQKPDNSGQKDAIAAALARAATGATESTPSEPPRGPSGPPLSSGEKDALRLAVASCWNTGSLSTEALRTTVIVAVSMTEDAKPMANTIRLVSSSGGGAAAARSAFDAARRAIIRCGVRGYGLPVEKYDQWRDIEMTFNPEKMRIK